MATQSFTDATVYPLGACCSLSGEQIQPRNPYKSELMHLFLGRIPEAARTLDLPVLDSLRPHFLPPSLLLPSHTFLLPAKAPSGVDSRVSPLAATHVLDCSFMPSHPHCLVCCCTGGAGSNTVFSLDLHACRIIQAFALGTETSTTYQPLCIHAGPVPLSASHAAVACCPCSVYSQAPRPPLLGSHATSRVSCVTMHRDPSSPLLFLGTSAGDVLAYDLRFPGGRFRSSPCLCLRGAHDGDVSGVRAATGSLLHSHYFFSSGLIDGWIKRFDLRFPFHYSKCVDVNAATRIISSGDVPYPVEAVRPSSNFGVGGRASSTEGPTCTKSVKNHRDASQVHREVPSAATPNQQRTCVCCTNGTRGSGGIAGMDLSPDGTLLAVAHVRTAPPGFTDAEEGYPAHVTTSFTLAQSRVQELDGESLLFTGARETDGDGRATGTLSERENTASEWRTVASHKGHPPRPEKLRYSARPRTVRPGDRVQSGTEGWSPIVGETIIYSVSEGLRVLKSFAVADGYAFTGVEFSANGKYLLQTGGTIAGVACKTRRSYTCCCTCHYSTPSYNLHDEGVTVGEPFSPFSSNQHIEAHRASARCSATVSCRVRQYRTIAKQRSKARSSIDEERSEERFLNGKREDADRLPWHTETATESSHRAQIVNLIQCNRVALLKSPADGALAFTDTSVMKHSFASKESEMLRCGGTHAKDAAVPHHSISASSLEHGSPCAVSIKADDPDDSFTLKLHVAGCTSQASSRTHSVCSGSQWSSVELTREFLPLHLKLYSPSSQLLERRRQAFAQTGVGCCSPWRRSWRFTNMPPSRCAAELGVQPPKSSCRRQRKRIFSLYDPVSSTPGEFTLSDRGSTGVFRCKREFGHLKDLNLHRNQHQIPFPGYDSQTSFFLTACGALHPQWGRHDRYGQRFLCTFWGGLVAGLGGSRLYPGLKLWHAATGVVLTCAEGPLATDQAVRCVRAHPDLSLGVLATGGCVRIPPGASATPPSNCSKKRNISVPHAQNSSVQASGGGTRVTGIFDTGNPLRRPPHTCAAVTLWTLEHRDSVLESALEAITDQRFSRGSLMLDPSDED